MAMFTAWFRRLTTTLRSSRAERELDREVASHLALLEDDFRSRGMSVADARAAARRAFGGVAQTKEHQRDARSFVLVEQLKQDVRFAMRSMLRTPGFAAAAILTLALGIGANTAIFSLLDAVVLRSLPLHEPGRLFYFAHGTGSPPSLSANYPLLERYRANLTTFDGITAYNTRQFKVSTSSGPELVNGQFASGNYHQVLGVRMALGRGLLADSDKPDAANVAAVISDGYWTRRFGRDPGIVGRTLVIQGRTVPIVGVTAAGFHGMRPGTQIDVTLTLAQRALDEPAFLTARDSWTSMYLVGRLKSGVSEAAALSEVQVVFRQFWNEAENRSARARSNDEPASLTSAARGSHTVRQVYREPLRILMAMVGIVLLIACANVANLLLARASARTREVAVRMSLGAGRARLVRQFLTESIVLALAGGALGLLIAAWGTRAVAAMLDAGTNPIVLDVEPDARVLLFTMIVSMLTGVIFGLAPAIRATRVDVTPMLKATAPGDSGRQSIGVQALVVSQIALCVVLLAGGGLLVRSLVHLKTQDTGFRKENLVLFYVDARGSQTSVMTLHESVLERLRAVAGVRAAAFSTMSPLATDEETRPVRIIGSAPAPRPRAAVTNRITPDFLSTFGIPILRGRGITAQDTASAARVAVVNETMAREYFDGDAIGRTFAIGARSDVPVTVVGVVRDNRQRNLRQTVPPMAYVPLLQAEEPPRELTASLLVDRDPGPIEALAREVVRGISPDLIVSYVRTMEQQVNVSLMPERLLATLSGAFVAVALFLAAIGLYGVISYGVARRVHEIGVRMALGATAGAVLRLVLGKASVLAIAGIVIGLTAAYQTTRLVSSFLYGVTERDPLTFVGAGVVLFAASALAGYLPARRATRIDPLIALRSE